MTQIDYKNDLTKYKFILIIVTVLAMVANIYIIKTFSKSEMRSDDCELWMNFMRKNGGN